MTAKKLLHNIVVFLTEVIERDRYLTEVFAALVTFGTGVIALGTRSVLDSRQALSGFRDMPCPEFWMICFALPGVISAIKIYREGEHREGRISFIVMASFVVMAIVSMILNLDNWTFWTILALQLGILKGYALILEWGYLRWSVACLGSFFWIGFVISIIVNTDGPLALSVSPVMGWAAVNLLSVWRARGKRDV